MKRIEEILDALPNNDFLAGETQYVKQIKSLHLGGYLTIVGKSDKAHGYVSIWRKTGKRPNGTKTCGACKRKLPYSMFCTSNHFLDGLDWQCKDCENSAPSHRRKHVAKESAKDTAIYMHDIVGLRIMSKLYPSIKPIRLILAGYTHTCDEIYAIAYRCASRFQRMPPRGKNWVGGWHFNIHRPRLYGIDSLFLLAFDDRESQNLLHIWRIHKEDLPQKKVLTMYESSIDKYRKWEISLSEVLG